MSYRVRYRKSAADALADIWLNSPDPNAVSRASDRAERALRNDPLGVGESRAGSRRVVFVDPLVIDYVVDPANREAIIVGIRPNRHP